MKSFYVHHQALVGKQYRGFTAKVEPVPSDERSVNVAVAFCSRKDRFCKATGRNVVEQQVFNTINKRHLPGFLAKAAAKTEGYIVEFPRDDPWYYILKYVV